MSEPDLPLESADTPDGPGLFGDDLPPSSPAKAGAYLVLARKYRPTTFPDLIGQEAMVRALSNAFAMNRIAHAFMLTGVRGVGKTTTARLLARALNYRAPGVEGPSITLEPLGEHCQAIMDSRHPDVLELDAASRTGVGDMRDLLEGVRYAPISARFKVYIIDEVHMLSTAAFNALLKTLEEPPAHVKFIFATTEIRKVPVTVLSRCQRFDLRRLEPDRLLAHLQGICAREGAAASEEALGLIARAAEGSVRDALSILDQAIVQAADDAEGLTAARVRDMLGLADRSRLIDLLEHALKGEADAALDIAGELYRVGGEPAAILRDLVELTAELAKARVLGAGYRYAGTRDMTARLMTLAEAHSPAQADRHWRVVLDGMQDLTRAPDPFMVLEMTLLRLAAASQLPPPEAAAKLLAGSGQVSAGAAASEQGGAGPRASGASSVVPLTAPGMAQAGLRAARAGGAEPRAEAAPIGFQDLSRLMVTHREHALLYEAERFLRIGTLSWGNLTYALVEGAPADLARRVKAFIETATGLAWQVRFDASIRAPTPYQAMQNAREERLSRARSHATVRALLTAFPGAELMEVLEQSAASAEVIDVDFGAGPPGPDAPDSADSLEGFEPDWLPAVPDPDDAD